MKTNVGNTDRIARTLVGLAILSLLVWVPGNERWWGLLGLIPLATAAVRWCPAYDLLGASTEEDKR